MKPLSLLRLIALYRVVREVMDDRHEYVPSRIRFAFYDVTREDDG